MSEKKTHICDVCKKSIEGYHQRFYMASVVIKWRERLYDDGTEDHSKTCHVHNDFSNHCLAELWKILEKS